MFNNTVKFSEAANHFLKTLKETGKGYYTNAHPGTFSYKEFWDEEWKRIQEGYTVNGVRITGEHYGYLNYSPILRTSDDKERKYRGKRKELSFPDFYDTDYDYYHRLEEARMKEKGMIVAKSRRKGFSYKNAWMVAHQFVTVRNSINIVAAYLDGYADNTIGMVIDNLNFLNKNTAFKRQRNPDRRDFMKAQFKEVLSDGTEVWQGYGSEIHKITFKDDPFKSIGKSCNIMLWEEAGKWPNLKESYRFAEPTWMDGIYMTGLPIIFGTGGDMEGGTADFSDMFYNPDTYNLLAFDNTYDENATTKCGYFVPDYKSKPGFIDKDGNSLEKEAKDYELGKRKIIQETTKSAADLYAYVSQYPFTPKEAFRRIGGNMFPVELLQEQLAMVETTKRAKDLAQIGKLLWKDGEVEWMPSDELNYITNFPLKSGDRKEGAICIWEQPQVVNGQIPFGLYIAGVDPYDIDDAEYSPSLGSTFIFKRMYSAEGTYNWPVAEYTGRPETAEEYYENVRKLLVYYNAHALYENMWKGIFQYFETKYCTHLLKDQPEIIKEIVKDGGKVNRGKGIHMVTGIKRYCEIITRDWLKEEFAPGQKNLTKIYSRPLLQELIDYNTDEGNFDRVIAFMLCILYNMDLYKTPEAVDSRQKLIDPFWNKVLFAR